MQQLSQKLDFLNSTLDRLIAITYEEIEMVKSAQHDKINAREHEKTTLLKQFEYHKEALNQMLLEVTQANPQMPMEEILDEKVQAELALFRQKLATLHEANKIYGAFVATLSEFFSSLIAAILPMKEEGYARCIPKPAAFLEVSA